MYCESCKTVYWTYRINSLPYVLQQNITKYLCNDKVIEQKNLDLLQLERSFNYAENYIEEIQNRLNRVVAQREELIEENIEHERRIHRLERYIEELFDQEIEQINRAIDNRIDTDSEPELIEIGSQEFHNLFDNTP